MCAVIFAFNCDEIIFKIFHLADYFDYHSLSLVNKCCARVFSRNLGNLLYKMKEKCEGPCGVVHKETYKLYKWLVSSGITVKYMNGGTWDFGGMRLLSAEAGSKHKYKFILSGGSRIWSRLKVYPPVRKEKRIIYELKGVWGENYIRFAREINGEVTYEDPLICIKELWEIVQFFRVPRFIFEKIVFNVPRI